MQSIGNFRSLFCGLPENHNHTKVESPQPSSTFTNTPPTKQDGMIYPVYPKSDTFCKSDLLPGDILMYRSDGSSISRGIQVGQSIPFLNPMKSRSGETGYVHVAIWVKDPKSRPQLKPQGPGDPEITESRNGVGVMNTALREGTYDVVRPVDSQQGRVAAASAKIAGEPRTIRYSVWGALTSVIRFSEPRKTWRENADQLNKNAFGENPEIEKGPYYCSQFVVSKYQGLEKVLGKPLSGALRVDARYVSPCQFDHLLKEDPEQFRKVAVLVVKPEDVTYRDVGDLAEEASTLQGCGIGAWFTRERSNGSVPPPAGAP